MESYKILILLFNKTHHKQIFILALLCLNYLPVISTFSQELLSINAYKTGVLIDGTGEWNDPSTWEIWDGMNWNPAPAPPSRDNDVFIEQSKEVRLGQHQEVRNLYLFSAADPGKKLNLQTYNLDVYGALRCFTVATDGEFVLYSSTSLAADWIYPETGNIVFKGTSRTVVDRSSWSGNNGDSRFGVIFNPEPDQTLTVNAVFKANSFVVQSGTVFQTVNEEGLPATSTFSFNFQDEFGLGAYGDFTIEPGATLISEGTREFSQIIQRSDTRPAANFHLKEGGTLVLLGEEPVIDAENILLEGSVHYSGETGEQQFISSTMSGSDSPDTYNHIFFEGDAAKILPNTLYLNGDFTYISGGNTDGTLTDFYFIGEGDQEVNNIALDIKKGVIVKPSGTLILDNDLTINEEFMMTSGDMDFMGNELNINGTYTYEAGTWVNLSKMTFQDIPGNLTSSNSTFPFFDGYLGGNRKLLLSGTQSSLNADLAIDYHQIPGVDWDPNFSDSDGTPILYQLNSFFTLTLTDFVDMANLELSISADELIVVDESDLRIVSDGAAAPGEHLPGLGDMEYIARREVGLNDLVNQNITLGSTGIASVLPVTWLSYSAEELPTGNLIRWSTAKETGNQKFVVLKGMDGGAILSEVGEKPAFGHSTKPRHYSYLDKSMNKSDKIYYQLKQVDLDGTYDFSPVFSLTLTGKEHKVFIYPNPYQDQKRELGISIPVAQENTSSQLTVKHISGKLLIQEEGPLKKSSQQIAERLKELPAGTYFIIIETAGKKQVLKWLKRN